MSESRITELENAYGRLKRMARERVDELEAANEQLRTENERVVNNLLAARAAAQRRITELELAGTIELEASHHERDMRDDPEYRAAYFETRHDFLEGENAKLEADRVLLREEIERLRSSSREQARANERLRKLYTAPQVVAAQLRITELEAEVERLRRSARELIGANERLRKLYNKAQDDASKEAERRVAAQLRITELEAALRKVKRLLADDGDTGGITHEADREEAWAIAVAAVAGTAEQSPEVAP